MTDTRFDAAMAAAQQSGDWSDVISLYIAAAECSEGEAFYLTHAYVHALEADDPRAADLKARLVELGAEIP